MQLVVHHVWMEEKRILCEYKFCICYSVTFLCCLGRVILVMIDATGVL